MFAASWGPAAAGFSLPAFTGFAAAFGGNAEVRLTGRLAYRLIQPELFLTRLGAGTQRDLRLSTGLVFLFGK